MNLFMLAHCVTATLAVLKLAEVTAVASWSWWWVLMPSFLAFGVAGIMFLIVIAGVIALDRR